MMPFLLGVIYRRTRKGRPGTTATASHRTPIRPDPRRRSHVPDPRRLILLLVVTALISLAVAASASAGTLFTNSALIKIPASGSSGTAAPYPSQIAVSGMSGPITDVNVTLHRVGHTFPSDIAVLLVSPSGDTVKLMQANCGVEDIEDFTWIFDQQTDNPMPGAPAARISSTGRTPPAPTSPGRPRAPRPSWCQPQRLQQRAGERHLEPLRR